VRGRLRRIVVSLVLGVVGLAVGGVMVSLLREATLSTHQPVSPYSQVQVTVHARVHNTERNQSLAEAVEAQLLTCRLEVTSDIVKKQSEPEPTATEGEFTMVMQPALDETNRRQFKGCVEDFVTDGLQMDVVEMRDLS
jgi:hypothetical protein